MEQELLDCHWCGSARSVEHGMCQVCMMEYPYDAEVISLPLEQSIPPPRTVEAGAVE